MSKIFASSSSNPTSLLYARIAALGLSLILLAANLAHPLNAQSATDDALSPSSSEAAPELPSSSAPNLVRWNGSLPEAAGRTVEVRFTLYQDQAGGLALWNETQTVKVGPDGRYSVLLGVTSAEGLPQSIFSGGAARWVDVRQVKAGSDPDAASETQPRSLLAAVPYAFKSVDSETLAGRAAADYVTREDLQSAVAAEIRTAPQLSSSPVKPMLAGTGAAGSLAYWSDPATLGDSALSQSAAGDIVLLPSFAAPGGTGLNSAVLEWSASSNPISNPIQFRQFNFGWQAWANGSTSSSGTLDFATSHSIDPPLPTGLSFGINGLINFAPGQQIPGAVNAVTPGFGMKALNSSNSVSLSVDPTVIPTLSASNIFTGASNTFTRPITFASGQAFPGTVSLKVGNSFQVGQTFQSSSVNVAGGKATAINASSEHDIPIIATGYYNGIFASANGEDPMGVGVQGKGHVGVAGISTIANYVGKYGVSQIGVYGDSDRPNGVGVSGTGPSGVEGSGTQVGVIGEGHIAISGVGLGDNAVGVRASSAAGRGVTGIAGGTSGVGSGFVSNRFAGVWGDTNGTVTTHDPGVDIAGVLGTADNLSAGYFVNNSSENSTLYIRNINTGGPSGLFKTLTASSQEGTCGFGGRGDMTCTGQVKTLATTGGGARTVETYAMQSPENWMEDFGSGEIANGVAIVTIDPAFAETVSDTAEYHVLLTPKGASKGLYVTHQTASGFEVRESRGGASSLSFDYRIVAKRRGFESQRLTDVTDEFKRVEQQTPGNAQPPSRSFIAKQ